MGFYLKNVGYIDRDPNTMPVEEFCSILDLSMSRETEPSNRQVYYEAIEVAESELIETDKLEINDTYMGDMYIWGGIQSQKFFDYLYPFAEKYQLNLYICMFYLLSHYLASKQVDKGIQLMELLIDKYSWVEELKEIKNEIIEKKDIILTLNINRPVHTFDEILGDEFKSEN